ncbi:MAG: gliding motility-associated C-terminal domain-containing protein [Sphingobacteriales bacterium]|nr:gliding motility-associated C-terminal domain-containing protein [Sphingobacteriales bacterium]
MKTIGRSLLLFSLLLILFGGTAFSQTLNFEWAKSVGTSNFDIGNSIALSGTSVVTVGQFDGTADFDPGPGVFNLVSSGSVDLYVLKLDTSGQFIWAKRIGNTQFEDATCVNTDDQENIYVTGNFTGTVDFDPGPGVFNVSSGSGTSCFVLKLNSAGDLIWVKSYVGVNVQSFALDSGGDIVAVGHFSGSIDFDPGPGVFTASSSSGTTWDLYILKLDNNGNFKWMRQLRTIPVGVYMQEVYPVKTDALQNIYVGGAFVGSVDFDPGPATATAMATSQDIFILKLDPGGNYQWVKTTGGGPSTRLFSMELDNAGNIYSTGSFLGTADLDPGAAVFSMTAPTPGQNNGYVLKLDNSGNFIFAKQFVNNASRVRGISLTLDWSDNIYIGGDYFGQVDLDPGPGVFNIGTPSFFGGAFMAKLDKSGNFMWGINYRMNGDAMAVYSLKTDILKNIYFTGDYYGTVDFDPTAGLYNLTSMPLSDIDISKLSQCNNSINTLTASSCVAYSLNGISYTASGTYYQTLPNAVGCDSIIVLNLTITRILKSTTVTACDAYTWNTNTLNTSGVYRDTFLLANGCDSIAELNLTIHPTIRTTSNASICEGQVYGIYNSSGTYIDIYPAASGCDSIRTLNLVVNNKPAPNLGKDTALCRGESLILSPGKFKAYNWSDGNHSGTITVSDTGSYWVEVFDDNNCSATDSLLVKHSGKCFLFAIPTAFTPNNDGLNDVFKPVINMPVIQYRFKVYNRWGQVVFHTNNPLKGWDGRLGGTEQDPDIFIYMISFSDHNSKEYFEKGTFVLLR